MRVEQHYVVVSSALPPLLILCLHFLTPALACMDTVRTITFICYFPFIFLIFLLFSFSLFPISIHLIILNPASHVYQYTWYITCITHVLCLPHTANSITSLIGYSCSLLSLPSHLSFSLTLVYLLYIRALHSKGMKGNLLLSNPLPLMYGVYTDSYVEYSDPLP